MKRNLCVRLNRMGTSGSINKIRKKYDLNQIAAHHRALVYTESIHQIMVFHAWFKTNSSQMLLALLCAQFCVSDSRLCTVKCSFWKWGVKCPALSPWLCICVVAWFVSKLSQHCNVPVIALHRTLGCTQHSGNCVAHEFCGVWCPSKTPLRVTPCNL